VGLVWRVAGGVALRILDWMCSEARHSSANDPIEDIGMHAYWTRMTEHEERLVGALAWMCEQYIGTGHADFLDHQCMNAGERAVEVLESYGMVEVSSGRGAAWTETGKTLLDRT